MRRHLTPASEEEPFHKPPTGRMVPVLSGDRVCGHFCQVRQQNSDRAHLEAVFDGGDQVTHDGAIGFDYPSGIRLTIQKRGKPDFRKEVFVDKVLFEVAAQTVVDADSFNGGSVGGLIRPDRQRPTAD